MSETFEKILSTEQKFNNLDLLPKNEFVDEIALNLPLIKNVSPPLTSYGSMETTGSAKFKKLTHNLRPDSPVASHMAPQRVNRRSNWSASDSSLTTEIDNRKSDPRTNLCSKFSKINCNSFKSVSPFFDGGLKFKTVLEPLWETEILCTSESKSTEPQVKSERKSSELFGFCCCVSNSHEEDQRALSPQLCST